MSVERLTKRINEDTEPYLSCEVCNKKPMSECWSQENCTQTAVDRLSSIEDILGDNYDLDRLRELVEADRDGRLHIFPVKIGETVWFEDPDDVIRSEKIERHNAYTCTETIGFENSDIGKYVFFSREAAEAALKGEQNDVQGI